MNIQDIIAYKDNPEKESEFFSNIKVNNINSQRYDENSIEKKPKLKIKKFDRDRIKNLINDEDEKNNEDKNNSSNYSYTRSNLIIKDIEANLEEKNYDDKNIKTNIKMDVDNNCKTSKNNLNESDKKYKNNILDELIEKIKINENLKMKSSKLNLNQLDEELKLGLKQINQIQTKYNSKSIFNVTKNFEENQKCKEILLEINKTLKSDKYETPKYKNKEYFNYKNIKILNPTAYFHNKRKNNQVNQYIRRKENPSNNFYLSSIDGKAIIDGQRKNLNDNLSIILQIVRNSFNEKKDANNNSTNKRSFSIDKRNHYGTHKYPYSKGNRRINNYNKNYFFEELNKINSLLFS